MKIRIITRFWPGRLPNCMHDWFNHTILEPFLVSALLPTLVVYQSIITSIITNHWQSIITAQTVLIQTEVEVLLFFKISFWGHMSPILWSHWCSLFQTWVDSACGFQSQGGSIIACALLSFAHNNRPQSQLWIFKPRPVPILHLGMVRLPLEWPPSVTSGITGRGRIWTQDLAAQSPKLYWLGYPGRLRSFTIFTM